MLDLQQVTLKKSTGLVKRGRWRCTYPILIIVLRLGLNDVQPLFTRRNTSGTNFSSTVVFFTLAWHLRCPGSYAYGYRVHHLITTLTTSRGLCPGNYVSRYGVNHPSQALTAARGQRSLMYSIPPPHSMLEEDSRYPRNALGTRTVTYWLLNT